MTAFLLSSKNCVFSSPSTSLFCKPSQRSLNKSLNKVQRKGERSAPGAMGWAQQEIKMPALRRGCHLVTDHVSPVKAHQFDLHLRSYMSPKSLCKCIRKLELEALISAARHTSGLPFGHMLPGSAQPPCVCNDQGGFQITFPR